jgi:hypothetical protein
MSVTFSPALDARLKAYHCSAEERSQIADVIFAVEWAELNAEPIQAGSQMLVIAPAKLHRSAHFKNGRRTRVDRAIALLAQINVVHTAYKHRKASAGRPRGLIFMDSVAQQVDTSKYELDPEYSRFTHVPSDEPVSNDVHILSDLRVSETRSTEQIRHALVSRLLVALGKVTSPDEKERIERDLPEEPQVVPAEPQAEYTPAPRIVIKAIHDFGLSYNGIIIPVMKGEKIDDPVLVRYLLEGGFPVIAADQNCLFQMCPKCLRRIDPDTYVPSGRKSYRIIREFLLAACGLPCIKFTPGMIIDDPIVVRELRQTQTPEQPILQEIQEWKDFIRCSCSMVFFPDDKLRYKVDTVNGLWHRQ